MDAGTSPRVLVFPFYPANPWSDILYRSLRDTGFEILAADGFDRFSRLIPALGAGDVVHVQWTAPIADGRAREHGRERAARFLLLIERARARGVAVIWTVHNLVAHDASDLELEVALARGLAEAADVVHVLNPATAAEAVGLFALPESRTRLIRHSGYQGAYPDVVARSEARADRGIEPNQVAVLHFGQRRAYKGADLVSNAVASLFAEGAPMVLLDPGAERVPDVDVQRWFRAADLTVLPYRSVLNSGTAMLSATFGVPVMLPDLPALRALLDGESWVHWFDNAAPDGLAAALGAFRPREQQREAARRFADRYPPREMSVAFRDLVEETRMSRLAAVRSR